MYYRSGSIRHEAQMASCLIVQDFRPRCLLGVIVSHGDEALTCPARIRFVTSGNI